MESYKSIRLLTMFSSLPTTMMETIISYTVPYRHVLLHEDMLPNKSVFHGVTEPPMLYIDRNGLYWMKEDQRQNCIPFVLCEGDSITMYEDHDKEIRIEHMDWTTFSYRNRIKCIAVDEIACEEWVQLLQG